MMEPKFVEHSVCFCHFVQQYKSFSEFSARALLFDRSLSFIFLQSSLSSLLCSSISLFVIKCLILLSIHVTQYYFLFLLLQVLIRKSMVRFYYFLLLFHANYFSRHGLLALSPYPVFFCWVNANFYLLSQHMFGYYFK